MLRSEAGNLEQRYLDFVYQPIFGAAGDVEQIFVVGYDVTEEKTAAQLQRWMASELSHRVKNTLAMVQAIAGQTLRDGVSAKDAREAFGARVLALARAQDVLTSERQMGADVAAVITNSLAHLGGDAERISIDGPAVSLAPRTVTALAMALHELSTNATKYGALSTPEGRVSIIWDIAEEAGKRRLRIVWTEVGGPPVKEPQRTGFGSRLIKEGLAMELGGETSIVYDPSGVICTINAVLEDR